MDPQLQQAKGEQTEGQEDNEFNIRVIVVHVILFCATMFYGLFGALIFLRLEGPFEIHHLREHSERVALAQQEFLQLKWDQQQHGNVTEEQLEIAVDLMIRLHMEAFEQGIRADELATAIEEFKIKQGWLEVDNSRENNSSNDTNESIPGGSRKWHFHSSLFFTATLLTSIGYGNLVPISPFGRLFCIGYAFLGIPLTLVTIADVAKFLRELILKFGNWLERKLFKRRGRSGDQTPVIQRDAEQSDILLQSEPGTKTKLFVLFLLFAYMWAMSIIFSHLQHGWGLLESFYFTLMSLVTIGFGDYCPTLEGPSSPTSSDSYGWIFFIFVGLILSTLTVDMVGSSYIERIHTLGRGFHLGSLLTMLKIGRGEGGPDSARLIQQLTNGAYIPADLNLIPYIDQLLSQRPSTETMFPEYSRNVPPGNGSAGRQLPSSAASNVSFLPDPTASKMGIGNVGRGQMGKLIGGRSRRKKQQQRQLPQRYRQKQQNNQPKQNSEEKC